MLDIHKLSKRYDDHLIVQGLTRRFPPGCVALCEQDSTGKTTLLNMIAGLIAPDEGDIWIDGHSMIQAAPQAKARVRYVPDNCLAFPVQTGWGYLEQIALETSTQLDDEVLDWARRLGLTPHLDKRFEQMSTGTRRKVFLTAAALGNPAVVLADGPSNGLDTQARAVLAEQFGIWAQDRVVLFASHDAEFVRACGARMVSVAALR